MPFLQHLSGIGLGLNWLCDCAIGIQSEPNNYDLAHGKENIKISIQSIGKHQVSFFTAWPSRWSIGQATASVGR